MTTDSYSDWDYIVIPGFVTSARDGSRHYITARQLVRLYGVREADCIVVHLEQRTIGLTLEQMVEYPILIPRHDGDYSLDRC